MERPTNTRPAMARAWTADAPPVDARAAGAGARKGRPIDAQAISGSAAKEFKVVGGHGGGAAPALPPISQWS